MKLGKRSKRGCTTYPEFVLQRSLFFFFIRGGCGSLRANEVIRQFGHFLLHFGPPLLGVLLGLGGQLAVGQFKLHQE